MMRRVAKQLEVRLGSSWRADHQSVLVVNEHDQLRSMRSVMRWSIVRRCVQPVQKPETSRGANE